MSMIVNLPDSADYEAIEAGKKAAQNKEIQPNFDSAEERAYWLVGYYSVIYNWDIEY